MPRKPVKPREQKIAEEFFPVQVEDVKYSIEKKHSPLEVELPGKKEKTFIEKTEVAIAKRPKKKALVKSKKLSDKVSSETKTKKEQYKTPKVSLKEGGYELIITEKPQAALKIASALGKSIKRNVGNVPYYEVNRQGKKLVVACSVGHLFTLRQKNPGQEIPVFDLMWVPSHFVKKNDFSKKYYDVLVKLAKNAGSLTVATDYDIEGEVIGLNIVRFIVNQKDASRMKFSTLTEKELNIAYDSKKPNIDWGQAIAGETRHNLDWLYGINVSRMLMNAIKTTGRFRVFSIGRVQGPSLNLIVKKEKEISAFKSEKYWQVFITLEKPSDLEFIYKKDIFKKSDLRKFDGIIGKNGMAETKKTQENLQPNTPFNLTALQTESYRLFGLNPGKTLATAQSLYLAGLISYPRTSSQKLPPAIGYKEILENLAKKYNVKALIKRDKPLEGKKSDPAHPSIYPTAQNDIDPKFLPDDEKKVYDLIVKRFLCLFMEDAIIENKTINVDVNNENEILTFIAKGSAIQKKSWLEIYPSRIKEKEIPDVNGTVVISNLRTEEKETQPPRRYSPASIITELEKRNLGTKTTRASNQKFMKFRKKLMRRLRA